VHFKLQIWKITQEIKIQVISSQIPYLLIGMDHAKHFQLQIDAKQGYLKQDNHIQPLEPSFMDQDQNSKQNISFIQIVQCSKVCDNVQPIEETSIHLDQKTSFVIGTK